MRRVQAEADVDEEVPPTRDTCFEVFRLDATLRWDAATKSPAVKSLVDNRDLIFEAQDTVWAESSCRWVIPWRAPPRADEQATACAVGRQETSRELVNELLVASTNRGLGSDFLAWKRFCKLAKIPQFPITFPLIALCAVARCSMQTTAGYPKTFIGTLGRFKAATDTVWGKHAVLDAIDAICGDGKETLRVFMTERKPVPRGSSSSPSSRPSFPSTASRAVGRTRTVGPPRSAADDTAIPRSTATSARSC